MSDSQIEQGRTWASLLDQLERNVQSAERLLAGDAEGTIDAWQPPHDMAPMPKGLVARARALLGRQQAVLGHLESERLTVRRHLQLVEVDAAKGLGSGPHFIDERT